jgi:predicted MFS family arabinose efflux permease
MTSVRIPPVVWTMTAASGLTTLGTIPVFLLSAQAVFVRSDLRIDAAQFGAAVSAFFASAAAAALLGGGLVDRLPRRTSTLLAGALATAGGLGMATVVHSWLPLLVLMVVLGTANAACQVTSNLTLARALPPHRRGLGFGVKQAAIPLSIALAGLAVPVIGAAVGWRWSFVLTGAGGVLVVALGLRMRRRPGQEEGARSGPDRPPRSALVAIMVAVALASAAANSLGAFLALWSFEVGLSPSQAGVLMATGSALNIVARVFAGYRADLRHGRNLPVVAAQMLVGALALAALSVAAPQVVVPAALVAFAVGWSWPGLLLHAVVRVGREAPALATGTVQAGAFVGGAAGPFLFGLAVEALGYPTSWRVAAAVFLVAALLVVWGRRLFVADLIARPPATPFGFGGGRAAPRRTTGGSDGPDAG